MLASSSMAILLATSLPITGSADLPNRYSGWERQLRDRVERLHHVPAAAQKTPPCAVVIRFHVGDGRPRGATIAESSCRPSYERRALRLVRSLGTIGKVPSATGRNHAISLKINYGSLADPVADRRYSEVLYAEARDRSHRNLAIVAQH